MMIPFLYLAHRAHLVAACVFLIAVFAGQAAASDTHGTTLAEMRQIVADASRQAPAWNGPRTGPSGLPGKTIAIVSEDMRNGGILGVVLGIREAAGTMRWGVKVFDAMGTSAGRARAMADALAARPDGLILVGADAEGMRSQLMPFARRGIPIVGWHVGPKAGLMTNSPVAMNVSTDPLEVARIAAMAAVVASGGRAGVVIFTDTKFGIAKAKAQAMAEVVRDCRTCALLEVRDVAISRNEERMPAIAKELLAKYGSRWTFALAINDIYFDYAVPELIRAGLPNNGIGLFSAGDGSATAFMRVLSGMFQAGTVAEPLNLHGWQLVDELNRLLAHQPPSGYVAPAHLVTLGNSAFDGGTRFQYDPDNGYRDIYRRIWQR